MEIGSGCAAISGWRSAIGNQQSVMSDWKVESSRYNPLKLKIETSELHKFICALIVNLKLQTCDF